MFQNAFILNVAINIYGGRDAIFFKIPINSYNYFILFICFLSSRLSSLEPFYAGYTKKVHRVMNGSKRQKFIEL